MCIEPRVVATRCTLCCAFVTCGAVPYIRIMMIDHTARSGIYDSRPEHASPQEKGSIVLTVRLFQPAE